MCPKITSYSCSISLQSSPEVPDGHIKVHGDSTQGDEREQSVGDSPGENIITPFGRQVELKVMTQKPPQLMITVHMN